MNATGASGLSRSGLRFKIGISGLFVSGICSVILILAMTGIISGLDAQIMHQSGIRWLCESAVAGMLVAAIAFWQH